MCSLSLALALPLSLTPPSPTPHSLILSPTHSLAGTIHHLALSSPGKLLACFLDRTRGKSQFTREIIRVFSKCGRFVKSFVNRPQFRHVPPPGAVLVGEAARLGAAPPRPRWHRCFTLSLSRTHTHTHSLSLPPTHTLTHLALSSSGKLLAWGLLRHGRAGIGESERGRESERERVCERKRVCV